MNYKTTKAWQQYERGKEYKRRIGLYETIRQNERFYRGDQWGSGADDLPKPVFNVVKRITDYLICSVASGEISIHYSGENLPFVSDSELRSRIADGIDILTKNAAYRWEETKMPRKIYRMLTDAAVAGDAVLYSYWDPDIRSGQRYSGDIATELIDNVNLFVSDVNRADIQSQEYIILSGRDSVMRLRAEAEKYGVDKRDILKILSDSETDSQSGSMASFELEGDEEAKATYLIKFWREGGEVMFEKSTKECVIRRCATGLTLYPVAYFSWTPVKNSFHGAAPISAIIPNQKYINRAYAMVMKHMTDTAFSKVIYDKTRIPEWSNEVGEAIGAVGGTNVSDAVSVVGVGQMQNGYLELIHSALANTKELVGATDTALGNVTPTNTSAIMAVQEASKSSLEQLRIALIGCIEDLANIWADMMCRYYPSDRLLKYREGGEVMASSVDFELLRKSLVLANVDICDMTKYSASTAQSLLDKLLDGGYISARQYIERLPSGAFNDRQGLIDELSREKRGAEDEQGQ